MLKRREKILKRIYVLVELIEKNDSDEYVQELTILLHELSELSINVDKINALFSTFLPIMLVINKNEELCHIVLKLKEKQIYLNSKTRIENGILKEFPISKIIEVPRNVKTVCGWREDSEINKDIIFYNCFELNENIERVICPNTVEIIGEKAFMHCINLEEVEIIKTGNQHLKTIGLCAFSSCTKLKKINLPNTLERIEEFAFSSIPNLTIYFDGTKEEWDKINKKDKWNQDSHINIIFKEKKEVLKFKNKMERLHRYCSFNVELVKKSAKCHCFYCKSSFDASETLKEGAEILDDGQTVVCPICGIDSVLPDAIREPINEEVLGEMHNYWF